MERPTALVFAGDHGAAPYVSAFPSAVSAAVVRTALDGRAACSVLAQACGVELVVVDAGLIEPLPPRPGFRDLKVAPGTQDWRVLPAMRGAEAGRAIRRAEALVDEIADGGATVLALGEIGIGNTASAALVAHKLTGLPLDGLIGRGAGLDDAGLARKRDAAAHGAARATYVTLPQDALREYGGFEIAMLVAAILAAARRRVLAIIDGTICTAAALVAHAIDPACLEACVFAHRSAEQGHDAMLSYLGVRPLLDIGMRLGEGTGAILAVPLLRAAAAVLSGMADLSEVA